jgi:hypothetical protein
LWWWKDELRKGRTSLENNIIYRKRLFADSCYYCKYKRNNLLT